MHKRIKKYQFGGTGFGNPSSLLNVNTSWLNDSSIDNMLLDYANAGNLDAAYLYTNNNLTNSIKSLGDTVGSNTKGMNLTKTGNIASIAGQAADLVGSFIPKGEQSTLTTGLNTGYDAISDAVAMIPGYGWIISGAMKVGGLLSDGLSALGAKTDQLTSLDKILDSKFFKLTPTGLINSIFTKKTNSLTDASEALEQIGSSFTGFQSDYNEAEKKAGKKVGGISHLLGLDDGINDQIDLASRRATMVNNINDENNIAQILKQNPYNGLRYYTAINGGFYNTALGKKGMKILQKEREFAKAVLAKKGTKTRTIDQLIEYAKQVNPRFIQRLSEPIKSIQFTDDSGNKVTGTHYLEYSTDDKGKAIVYARIMENDNGYLQLYPSDEAYNKAIQDKDYLVMLPEEAEIFTASPDTTKGYKKGWPEFFISFKNGGQFNVIPDGALHARKHNLDMDNITKKGIPVITEDDRGIVQQAEIEVNEIIFRLEVTKKLEELAKKDTDEAAIEAGKLLVKEILENTIDNTGLIKQV